MISLKNIYGKKTWRQTRLTVEMSVKNGPATMQLARTLGPKVTASDMVRLLRPALAAASVGMAVNRFA